VRRHEVMAEVSAQIYLRMKQPTEPSNSQKSNPFPLCGTRRARCPLRSPPNPDLGDGSTERRTGPSIQFWH
jgi:hypothetical protein